MASHEPALHALRSERFFESWDEFIDPQRVAAAEASMRRLIDDLLALGPNPTEGAARAAVDECVRRFNALDRTGPHHWICTIEREDIFTQVCRVVGACGFDCQEDWLYERNW